MKKIALLGVFMVSISANAAKYSVDAGHTSIGFKVKHLVVSNVKGEFKKYDGEIDFDPANLKSLKVNASADVASVSTNEPKRDEHLRSPDFFDAEKFPKMTLVSKGIKNVKGNKAKMDADLTIHGVTKPVTFDVEFGGATTDPWGNKKVGFSASTKVSRKDFGLTWNKALETGGMVVGDEVSIELEVEANEKTAAKK